MSLAPSDSPGLESPASLTVASRHARLRRATPVRALDEAADQGCSSLGHGLLSYSTHALFSFIPLHSPLSSFVHPSAARIADPSCMQDWSSGPGEPRLLRPREPVTVSANVRVYVPWLVVRAGGGWEGKGRGGRNSDVGGEEKRMHGLVLHAFSYFLSFITTFSLFGKHICAVAILLRALSSSSHRLSLLSSSHHHHFLLLHHPGSAPGLRFLSSARPPARPPTRHTVQFTR
jgi:hypothetical protein